MWSVYLMRQLAILLHIWTLQKKILVFLNPLSFAMDLFSQNRLFYKPLTVLKIIIKDHYYLNGLWCPVYIFSVKRSIIMLNILSTVYFKTIKTSFIFSIQKYYYDSLKNDKNIAKPFNSQHIGSLLAQPYYHHHLTHFYKKEQYFFYFLVVFINIVYEFLL